MKSFRLCLGLLLSASWVSYGAAQPAVVFDMGGKFDGSFNEGVFNGVERYRAESGVQYLEFEVTQENQREEALRIMAESGGNPILGIGFAQADAVTAVAQDHPDLVFGIVDAVVDLPNVRSFIFKEQEGSFLVGLLAAMKTETNTISFVGGMDIPLIRKFECGYRQGAAYANPEIAVIANYTGNDASAWSNPTRGYELAVGQFEQGSDIVFAAAGSTGFGVLQAADDQGLLSIGVDSNQNHLHPGSVLTSMLKRVDVAAYSFFTAGVEGFEASAIPLGLAEDGVGYALDEHNAELISAEMIAAAEAAREAIVAGDIQVHDYTSDNSCPL